MTLKSCLSPRHIAAISRAYFLLLTSTLPCDASLEYHHRRPIERQYNHSPRKHRHQAINISINHRLRHNRIITKKNICHLRRQYQPGHYRRRSAEAISSDVHVRRRCRRICPSPLAMKLAGAMKSITLVIASTATISSFHDEEEALSCLAWRFSKNDM